ncbi:hypothetical protein GCM10023116_04450 [Kistimonas scapharcae]|uniref:Uncharacterized protein n=2 Tax=Kistimonas scapharcae TaxID=1036133 RepID=A0ABP8UYH0_9GAMM
MSRVVVGAGKSGGSVSVFRRIDKAILPCDATAASLPLLQTDTDPPDNGIVAISRSFLVAACFHMHFSYL